MRILDRDFKELVLAKVILGMIKEDYETHGSLPANLLKLHFITYSNKLAEIDKEFSMKAEPWIDEEERQMNYDLWLSKRPICICCGDRIEGNYAYYFEKLLGVNDCWLCFSCANQNEKEVENE